MSVEPRSLVYFSFLVFLAVGCNSTTHPRLTDFVGEYVFRPNNSTPGDFASFVILKDDQTAVEIRFSKATGQISTTNKNWYLSHTTGDNVVIGDFSYPIERSRLTIKLGINDDLGQYYEKVR